MSRVTFTVRRASGSSLAVLAALTCLGVAACGGGRDATTDTAVATSTTGATGATGAESTPAQPAASATLNDAQIAHVAVTANAIDSTAGVMAQEKGRSQAVKDFAKTMVTDHAGVNKQAVELVTRLNVTPEENDVSRQLTAGANQAADSLKALSGAAFDRAYIAREVAYHQAVLDALDKTLIPDAQNAELKKLLQDVRPAFAAHLDRARNIQGSLGAQ
jgi:putative membrane protein